MSDSRFKAIDRPIHVVLVPRRRIAWSSSRHTSHAGEWSENFSQEVKK